VARNPHLYGVNPSPKEVATIHKKIRAVTPKRIRQDSKPLMNKLETEALAHLKAELSNPIILIQAIRFKLGNGIWYKPDFFIFELNKPTAYEVKGPHAFRGGFENLKVAASLYPEIRWGLVWKEKTGQWVGQTVLP